MYPYDFVPWGETDCGRSNKKINITELKNTTTLHKFIFSIILVFIALSLSAWVEERGRDRPHTHLLLLLLHTPTHAKTHTYIYIQKITRKRHKLCISISNYTTAFQLRSIVPQMSARKCFVCTSLYYGLGVLPGLLYCVIYLNMLSCC